ncbi:aminoacyl-tRNA deacylase [Luteolibacter marinus]|uniref:aminoacyl-tRNA deacylase n=1 Tax=Luteolibacter marinus TaxID=2776705 RepID=UPI0018671F51|nr:YbaK/EbsC family protein [Luteolibacter marinus]
MIAKSLKDYLDRNKVKYITIIHSPAYTAAEVAQAAHIPGAIMAKTVMVEVDGNLEMAVVPANQRVRLDDIRDLTATDDVRLAHEDEFKRHFPDCEAGAMPPFGNLYDMTTFISPRLAAEGEIAFNAGSHTEVIRMNWSDYQRLVKPRVASFTV